MDANRERVRANQRRFDERHRESEKERKRKDREANIEQYREQSRQWYWANRGEVLAQRKEYVAANRPKVLASKMSRYHGSNWAEAWAAFWVAQDGHCYLCGDPLDREGYRQVVVEHDHSCCPLGKSCAVCRRGLACPPCNILIGLAADAPDRLRRIADNLEAANAGVRQRMAEKNQVQLTLSL